MLDIQPFRVAVPDAVLADLHEPTRPGAPGPTGSTTSRYNLVHFTSQPRGGHFAVREQPELFAADVAAFFRTLR